MQPFSFISRHRFISTRKSKMKNYTIFLLLLLFFSSCSLSIHSVSKGKIDTPSKESYQVTYLANFNDSFVSKISFTNEYGDVENAKETIKSWNKTIVIKAGKHVKFSIVTKGNQARGEYKVLVDGKILDQHILSGKKLKYNFEFDLP
ncbi:hypothetical protein GCM10022246_11520 [Pedobacter ginsengiterrae]|uniref:Uncharacterized protein n=2 Tax=Pedobacter ginsengiterrae TaxID=871696 RepID=A0ABP7P5B0_9SPHI